MNVSTIEFSRPFAVDALPAGGRSFAIEATARECAAVARRLGLVALHRLRAEGTVSPTGGDGVRMAGRLTAEVEQTCVVTLEAFAAEIQAPFETIFSRSVREDDAPSRDAHAIDADRGDFGAASCAEEFYEPLEGDGIDLGEAVTQQLAIELELYPRKPGAALPHPDGGEADDTADGASPFAVLRRRGGEPVPQ